MENNIISNRHDIYLLFEVTNGNPNGDPDMDNMPRQEDNTEKGLVSDVCLKRKIRNYVFLSNSEETKGRRIFIQNTHYLNDVIEEHHKNSSERLSAEGLLAKDDETVLFSVIAAKKFKDENLSEALSVFLKSNNVRLKGV